MIQDEHLILQLRRQDSRWTIIELSNGNKIRVFNIAWGYSLGAKFAHITSNISPEQKGSDIDFFHSNEIIQIADEDTDRIIWQRE